MKGDYSAYSCMLLKLDSIFSKSFFISLFATNRKIGQFAFYSPKTKFLHVKIIIFLPFATVKELIDDFQLKLQQSPANLKQKISLWWCSMNLKNPN